METEDSSWSLWTQDGVVVNSKGYLYTKELLADTSTMATDMTSIKSCLSETDGNSTAGCAGGGRDVPITTPVIMFLLGVFGNSLSLLVLHRSRPEAKKSVFYTIVRGLSLTDLLGQIMVSPVAIVAYANKLQWPLGRDTPAGQTLCRYHGFAMVFFGLITPLVVCLMAVERLIALRATFVYSRHVSHNKAKITIAVLYLVVFGFACLPLVGFGRYELQYPHSWCFLKFHFQNKSSDAGWQVAAAYSYLYATVNLIIIAITVVCNVLVIAILLRMRHRRHIRYNIPRGDNRLVISRAQREKEVQMVCVLCGMTLVFTTCWAPLMIRIIVSIANNSSRASRMDLLAVRMAAINQILDPWVYILLRKSLITGFAKIVRTLLCYPKTMLPTSTQSQTTFRQCCIGGRYCETSFRTSQRAGHIWCGGVCRRPISMAGQYPNKRPSMGAISLQGAQNANKRLSLGGVSLPGQNTYQRPSLAGGVSLTGQCTNDAHRAYLQNGVVRTQPQPADLQSRVVNDSVVTSVYRQDDLQVTNIRLPPVSTPVAAQTQARAQAQAQTLNGAESESDNYVHQPLTVADLVTNDDVFHGPLQSIEDAMESGDYPSVCVIEAESESDSFMAAGSQSPWGSLSRGCTGRGGRKSVFSSFKRLRLWSNSRWPDDNSFFSLPGNITERSQDTEKRNLSASDYLCQ